MRKKRYLLMFTDLSRDISELIRVLIHYSNIVYCSCEEKNNFASNKCDVKNNLSAAIYTATRNTEIIMCILIQHIYILYIYMYIYIHII